MSATMLRLDRLKLMNFRGFAECEIELHPRLTVLVAENGSGKTAILDAIGSALGLFIDAVTGRRDHHAFAREDVRTVPGDHEMKPMLPISFIADGLVVGQQLTWHRRAESVDRVRASTKRAADLRATGQALRTLLDDFVSGKLPVAPPLPMVAFYGTGRLWSEHRRRREKQPAHPAHDRFNAYVGCLSSSSSFKEFATWCRATAALARGSSAVAGAAELAPQRLLAAIERATTTALEPTGWRNPHWDFDQDTLVVEHEAHGRLPIAQLSDGVRNMIALVADLAHRCVRLNPHFGEGAAQQTTGIVLIDEVDMHLHPGWQQEVVGLMQRAFPAMQFVVSTHSPHVLSTVERTSIRTISVHAGRAVVTTPSFQTRGVESADVLAQIMNVRAIPQVPEAIEVREYRLQILDGEVNTPDARERWARLLEHFGKDHPVIDQLRTLGRLEVFRREHRLGGGG